MTTKRKMFPRVPFHQYALGELAALLIGPRNETTARQALHVAKLVRNIEIPVLHRDSVKENLTLVMAHFDVKRSKFFTRSQRGHFYGALDALKEKPAPSSNQHANSCHHPAPDHSGHHAPADGHIVSAAAGQVAL